MADLNKLAFFYSKAKKEYDNITPLYNEVLKYTDPFGTIDSTYKAESNITSRKSTLVAITEPLHTFVSFIMNSLLARGTKWSRLEFSITEENKDEVIKEMDLIIKELEENVDKTFNFLEQSNYYTEITRAVNDAGTLGTGCYRVLEQVNNNRPFTFKYQPINNLYVYDDAFGDPNYVYNNLGAVSVEALKDIYGDSLKLPPSTEKAAEYALEIEVIECVYPEYDESKGETIFVHTLVTGDLGHVLWETKKQFNPIVVFRFNKTSESSYGLGVGVKLLDTYKKLTEYTELRHKHAQKIVDPPGGFLGSPELFMKLSLKSGARNFLGTGVEGYKADYKPLTTGGTIVEITEDIQILKEEIREVCMGNPLGGVKDTTNRSASEMDIRFKLFRDKFANAHETFQEELLQKTFLIPFTILLNRGIIDFPEFAAKTKSKNIVSDLLEVSNFKYINKLSKAGDLEDVSNVEKYIQLVQQSVPEMAQYAVQPKDFLEYAGDKMKVPKSIRYTIDELAQQQQQVAQQAQAQQQAEMAQQQAEASHKAGQAMGEHINNAAAINNNQGG